MPGSMPSDPTLAASNSAPGGAAPGTANPNAPPQPAGPPAWLNGGALPGMPAGQRGLALPQPVTPQVPATDPNAGANSVSGNGGYGSSISGNGGFGSSPSTPTQPGAYGTPPGAYGTTPGSNQPNAGGFGQPGTGTSATNMINNLLTQPRPGGMPTGAGTPGIGGTVVGGFAGVASTYKGHGIIQYNEQDEYTKWEFYYDLGAEQAAAVQNQQRMMQGPQSQQTPGSTFGQPSTGQPTPFGQTTPPSQ